MNLNGKTFGELHGDISPMSISIVMNPQYNSFRVKILDFLKIRDLVEIAQQGTTSQTSARLAKPLPYDAPEKMYVNQKDLQVQADTWSLAVVLFEFMVCS